MPFYFYFFKETFIVYLKDLHKKSILSFTLQILLSLLELLIGIQGSAFRMKRSAVPGM